MSEVLSLNREILRSAFLERLADAELAERLMRAFEPFFRRAESGTYRLATRSRVNRAAINHALASAFGALPAEVEFVSLSRPVWRQGWMTDEGYAYFREVCFAYAIWKSANPWFDSALKLEFGAKSGVNWRQANNLLHDAFGNALHLAVNGTLFSGAMFPIEATLTFVVAFALAGNVTCIERLLPLMRLFLRAIPLGRRADSKDVWIVLVA